MEVQSKYNHYNILLDKISNNVLAYCYGINITRSLNKHPAFANGKIVSIMSKYLPPLNVLDEENNGKKVCYCIRSPMGSGKTTCFSKYITESDRALIIGCRKTYCSYMTSLLEKNKFINYQEINPNVKINHVDHPNIVIQLQSLTRLKDIEESCIWCEWNVVYLDEFDSILKELISDICGKKRKIVVARIIVKLLAQAQKVIVSGADIGHHHLTCLQNMFPVPRPISFINNHSYVADCTNLRLYKSCQLSPIAMNHGFLKSLRMIFSNQKHISIFVNELNKLEKKLILNSTKSNSCNNSIINKISYTEMFYFKIMKSWYQQIAPVSTVKKLFLEADIIYSLFRNCIRKKKHCAVVCASKKHANMLYSFFKTQFVKINVVLLTGDSSDEEKQIMSSCSNASRKYLSTVNLFIYTTCYKVGVDVNNLSIPFTDVYVLFDRPFINRRGSSFSAITQCKARIRQARILHVYMRSFYGRRNGIEGRQRIDENFVKIHKERMWASGNHLLDLIYSIENVEQQTKCHPDLFLTCFLKLNCHPTNIRTVKLNGHIVPPNEITRIKCDVVDLVCNKLRNNDAVDSLEFFLKTCSTYYKSDIINFLSEGVKYISHVLLYKTSLNANLFAQYMKRVENTDDGNDKDENYIKLVKGFLPFIKFIDLLNDSSSILCIGISINYEEFCKWVKYHHPLKQRIDYIEDVDFLVNTAQDVLDDKCLCDVWYDKMWNFLFEHFRSSFNRCQLITSKDEFVCCIRLLRRFVDKLITIFESNDITTETDIVTTIDKGLVNSIYLSLVSSYLVGSLMERIREILQTLKCDLAVKKKKEKRKDNIDNKFYFLNFDAVDKLRKNFEINKFITLMV